MLAFIRVISAMRLFCCFMARKGKFFRKKKIYDFSDYSCPVAVPVLFCQFIQFVSPFVGDFNGHFHFRLFSLVLVGFYVRISA